MTDTQDQTPIELLRAKDAAYDKGYAQGRIEGLKEAARNICLLCRKGKVVSIDHLHPIIILATGEVHYEFCQAAEIHARIQELEGEK